MLTGWIVLGAGMSPQVDCPGCRAALAGPIAVWIYWVYHGCIFAFFESMLSLRRAAFFFSSRSLLFCFLILFFLSPFLSPLLSACWRQKKLGGLPPLPVAPCLCTYLRSCIVSSLFARLRFVYLFCIFFSFFSFPHPFSLSLTSCLLSTPPRLSIGLGWMIVSQTIIPSQ